MAGLIRASQRLSRLAMLLLALALPCASSVVAESMEIEAETSSEVLQDFVTFAKDKPARKRQAPVCRKASDSFSRQSGRIDGLRRQYAPGGHRLSHDRLAPLRF